MSLSIVVAVLLCMLFALPDSLCRFASSRLRSLKIKDGLEESTDLFSYLFRLVHILVSFDFNGRDPNRAQIEEIGSEP